MMRPSPACVNLIKRFEGLSLHPYICPGGKWTIGYGHTKTVKPRQGPITKERAEELLAQDLEEFSTGMLRFLRVPVSQHQFDALVSLAFNIGLQAFRGSTLLRLLNQGDFASAAKQFPRWNRGGGKVLPGLVRRRTAEKALFLSTKTE